MQEKEKPNLINNRLGGSIAIRGFEFQFLYSCYSILMELTEEDLTKKIGLERLEDLDIIHKNEYVQLKTSLNDLDASFFIKTNILKNFLDLYQYDKSANFKLVHNSNISDGNLKKLQNKSIDNKTLEHWTKKINELDRSLNIDIKDFFESITFSRIVGFFAKNKFFLLSFDIAILIAQIATYRTSTSQEGFLPQGSPCSPIISNLIGNILDVKMVKLAKESLYTTNFIGPLSYQAFSFLKLLALS